MYASGVSYAKIYVILIRCIKRLNQLVVAKVGIVIRKKVSVHNCPALRNRKLKSKSSAKPQIMHVPFISQLVHIMHAKTAGNQNVFKACYCTLHCKIAVHCKIHYIAGLLRHSVKGLINRIISTYIQLQICKGKPQSFCSKVPSHQHVFAHKI